LQVYIRKLDVIQRASNHVAQHDAEYYCSLNRTALSTEEAGTTRRRQQEWSEAFWSDRALLRGPGGARKCLKILVQ
jgi:hypothetical protein